MSFIPLILIAALWIASVTTEVGQNATIWITNFLGMVMLITLVVTSMGWALFFALHNIGG